MMKRISMAGIAALAAITMAGTAQAGTCRDPWVTRAVEQVTGHAPNGSYESGDCSIYNYGGGHWSSYPDLVNKVRAHFGMQTSSAGVCHDPWVTRAIRQVMGRAPNGSGNSGECNIYRYGGGHWSSYGDLVNKVKVAFGRVPRIGNAANNRARISPNADPANMIRQNGGHVIAPGGGNVIAPGGGNVISAGGGNVISAGGGNVIAPNHGH